jgi:hypothetical protein
VALRSATTANSSDGIQGSERPYAVPQLPTLRPAYRVQCGLTQCRNCQQFGRHTELREVLRSVTPAKISAEIQGSERPYTMPQLPKVGPAYRAQ